MANDGFYISELDNGWTVGRFRALDELDGFSHAVTTRRGIDVGVLVRDYGQAAVTIARELKLGPLAYCDQVHGNVVLEPVVAGLAGQADGLVACRQDVGLMTRSADCPLILIADPTSGAVGTAHASWRGTAAQVAAQLVLKLVARHSSDPADLVACICPSAGPCCYQVGLDVVAAVTASIGENAKRFFVQRDGALYFDLWEANCHQLMRSGLRKQNIHVAGICTICRNDLFPSYRVEREKAGRFAAIIASR